jgi:hypothetical protein
MAVTLRLDVAYDPASLAQAAEIIANLRAMSAPAIDLTAGWSTRPASPAPPGIWPEATVDPAAGPGRSAPGSFSPSPSMGEGKGAGEEVPPIPDAGAAADRVAAWLAHLGPDLRAFWRAAARYAVDHPEFTSADLEAATGITRGTLTSRYRTSYRAIRAAHAPGPMRTRKDAKTRKFVYAMPPAVRDKILQLTDNDPR